MDLLGALGGGASYLGDIEQKFGGRAIKGLLAGKPRELLSPVPFSDTLGITDPKQATSGSELATKLGINHPLGNAAAGFGLDLATDPLTYFGGLGAAKATSGASKGIEAASNFSKMKGLRNSYGLVKDAANEGDLGARLIGQRAGAGVPRKISRLWPDIEERPELVDQAMFAAKQGSRSGIAGTSVPPWTDIGEQSGLYGGMGWARRDPGIARHEAHHGLIYQAAQNAMKQGVPISESGLNLPSRVAAGLLKSGVEGDNTFKYGLGNIAQEALGHAAEKRDALSQLGNAAKFMYSPEAHRGYHEQFSKINPSAAAVYHALPGSVPGAIVGAGVGGEQGYENSGVGGGVAGAALGGLAGAALGGGLSSRLLFPKVAKWSASLPADAIKELADLDRLRNPGESAAKLLKQYDRVAPAMDIKGTPVNRFQRLSEAAGIPFKLPRTEEDIRELIGSRNLSGTLAAYDPYSKSVIPNIKHFPGLWSDTNTMNQTLEKFGPQFSTPLSDQLALHEITHGIHHAQNTPVGVIKNPYFFDNLNAAANRENWVTGEPSLWSKHKGLVPSQVSAYGSTLPTEFVAERNPQRIMAHISDLPVGSPEMSQLYRELKGPRNPGSLLDELDRMYGGDINRALRGESSSVNPGAHTVPPNPVDLDARKALEGANWEMASGAPERFSTDLARRAYYAKERQLRYAQRMGAPKSLVEKLKAGLGITSGALAGPMMNNLFSSSAEA